MPRFSIVITATRPGLVGYAIRSAIAQNFRDFELVVSDNSDKGCRELVEGFSDPRIRYVRPLKYLTTVPHWNFAFSHASGEWQLLLCDDDAIAPNLLSILDKNISTHHTVDSIFWSFANYVDGDAEKVNDCFRLGIPGFSGRQEIFDSHCVIEEMFRSGTGLFRVKRKVPFLPQSVYSRCVIEKIRKRLGGQLLLPPCPMTSGAIAVLALSQKTLRLDLPLLVLGVTPDSAAGSFMSDRTIYNKMHHGVQIELAPVKTMSLFPSTNADALLRVQAAMPDLLGRYQLNLENYFFKCHLAIRQLKNAGISVSKEEELLEVALNEHPPDLRERVRARVVAEATLESTWTMASVPAVVLRKLRTVLRRTGAVLGYKRFSNGQFLDARKASLHDIVDCARFLGQITQGYS